MDTQWHIRDTYQPIIDTLTPYKYYMDTYWHLTDFWKLGLFYTFLYETYPTYLLFLYFFKAANHVITICRSQLLENNQIIMFILLCILHLHYLIM